MYGHGLFETMRLASGDIPLINYHLDRLLTGARKLTIPLDAGIVDDYISGFLADCNENGVVKLTVTAGAGQRGYRPSNTQRANIILQWFAELDPVAEIRLQVCAHRLPENPALAGIKHLNRLDQVLASLELEYERGISIRDGLLLDAKGNVIEALSSNIFCLVQGRWLTPDLACSGVAGVMRQFLIDEVIPAARSGSAPVDVTRIELTTLASADEIFICNAVRGITVVRALNDENGVELAAWTETPATGGVSRHLENRLPCFRA